MRAKTRSVAVGQGTLRRLLAAGAVTTAVWPGTAWAQSTAPAGSVSGTDLLNQVLQFTYTIAHAIGQAIVRAVQTLLPQATIPPDLVDPIGFLSVLTVFVLLAEVAKRFAWIIVGVGWVMIVVRLVLVVVRR